MTKTPLIYNVSYFDLGVWSFVLTRLCPPNSPKATRLPHCEYMADGTKIIAHWLFIVIIHSMLSAMQQIGYDLQIRFDNTLSFAKCFLFVGSPAHALSEKRKGEEAFCYQSRLRLSTRGNFAVSTNICAVAWRIAETCSDEYPACFINVSAVLSGFYI